MQFPDFYRALTAATTAVLLSDVSTAATLEEWKRAARDGGVCTSIPFSSIQASCKNRDTEVGTYCKGQDNPFSCKDRERAIMAKVNARKDAIAKRGSTSSSDTQKVADLQREIEDLEKDLKGQRSGLEKLLYNGRNCAKARGEMDEVFAQAVSSGKDDAKDPQIAPIAAPLIAQWELGREKHEPRFKDTVTAVSTCAGLVDALP